jgi:hypothetical protein
VPYATREAWLMALAQQLQPYFETHGGPLPAKLRIACGWPASSALGRQRRSIGECWPAAASSDGTVEIFISPSLACPLTVGATLTHELVHAAVGTAWGHKGAFKRLALAVGLAGPMRSTHAGPGLQARLIALVARLGPYPHATLHAAQLGQRKQRTRLLKVVCPTCGYTVRVTQWWLGQGFPVCPCGPTMIRSA